MIIDEKDFSERSYKENLLVLRKLSISQEQLDSFGIIVIILSNAEIDNHNIINKTAFHYDFPYSFSINFI